MAKARVTTVRKARIKVGNVKGTKSKGTGKRGNPNRCPTCGRFV